MTPLYFKSSLFRVEAWQSLAKSFFPVNSFSTAAKENGKKNEGPEQSYASNFFIPLLSTYELVAEILIIFRYLSLLKVTLGQKMRNAHDNCFESEGCAVLFIPEIPLLWSGEALFRKLQCFPLAWTLIFLKSILHILQASNHFSWKNLHKGMRDICLIGRYRNRIRKAIMVI